MPSPFSATWQKVAAPTFFHMGKVMSGHKHAGERQHNFALVLRASPRVFEKIRQYAVDNGAHVQAVGQFAAADYGSRPLDSMVRLQTLKTAAGNVENLLRLD